MFNSIISPSSLLSINGNDPSLSTPKTPEIVNSLIAMTNPMDNYNFGGLNGTTHHSANASNATTPIVTVRNFNGTQSQDSSQHSSCTASPLDSPAGTHTTPSVQQTCSQLIKAGLKLSIQSKRKLSTCDSSSGSEQPNTKCSRRDEDCDETTDDDSETKSMPKGLTPEDEDRRRRRRERNKIAATKCRMKKRERTQNLIKESEQLDTQNIDLKNQVRALETERRKLLEMLQAHAPTCVRHGGCNLPSKLLQSPAMKYFAELDFDLHTTTTIAAPLTTAATTATVKSTTTTALTTTTATPTTTTRTSIPPMSTIKFSRSKAVAAASAQMPVVMAVQQALASPQQQQLPNGYCKPSPSAQELGYLNSPTQDNNNICITALQQQQQQALNINSSNNNTSNNMNTAAIAVQQHQQHQQQQQNHLNHLNHSLNNNNNNTTNNNNNNEHNNDQLSGYIPNCDSNSLSLALAHVAATQQQQQQQHQQHQHQQHNNNSASAITLTTSTHIIGIGNNLVGSLLGNGSGGGGGDNSLLLSTGAGIPSPLSTLSTITTTTTPTSTPITTTPTTASEFVKNELVDSQSPYTTAQSAERFLFENNCDAYVDIKHAVSVHPGMHNNVSLSAHTNVNNNSSNNILDFHSTMLGTGIISSSFHDQISIKNDYLHESDLLAQLTDDAEFMDLDTGAATFITNGGCLA